MIEVDERFEVPSKSEHVWRLLADPYAIVGCVPGAAIISQAEDGSLETKLSVKFGPVSVAFQAHAVLALDHAQMTGRLEARGKDTFGGVRFQASATFNVENTSEGSLVKTRGEVDLTGRLASMIEAGAGVVVKRMSADFASCLRARCAGTA